MLKTLVKVKRWGNSFGIILPKKLLREKKIHTDDLVEIILEKKQTPLEEAFGRLKHKIPTKKLLREADNDLDPRD